MRRWVFAAAAVLLVLTGLQADARTSRASTAAGAATEPAPARSRTTRAAASTEAPARTARPATPAQEAQRQRMRDCNAEARTRSLTGASRSAFMRPCLSGHPPTAAPAAN